MVDVDIMGPQVSVLGCLLIEPSLMGEAMSQLRPEHFTSPPCRLVYQAMCRLFSGGQAVDPVLVRDQLQGFDDATAFLVQVMQVTPSAANFPAYVKALRRQAALLALRDIGQQLADTTSLEDAIALVGKANTASADKPGLARVSAQAMVEDFIRRHDKVQPQEYISFGLSKLDAGTYAERGDFVILGGYSSAGKTALSLRYAWHMARKYRVGYYSLETHPRKLGDRSMAALAGLDMGAIKRSALAKEDWDAVAKTYTQVLPLTLDFIPASGMTVQDIRADALANRYEVIYIDYLQLIQRSNPKDTNRVSIITDISIQLHQLSQMHGILVVALSQLSRPEKSAGGKNSAPDMHALRESGQLEQDADIIQLLYLERPDDPKSRRVLKVAKNKEGEQGLIYLDFDGLHQTFRESNAPPEGERVDYRRNKTHPTPVLSRDFKEITGKDENLPF